MTPEEQKSQRDWPEGPPVTIAHEVPAIDPDAQTPEMERLMRQLSDAGDRLGFNAPDKLRRRLAVKQARIDALVAENHRLRAVARAQGRMLDIIRTSPGKAKEVNDAIRAEMDKPDAGEVAGA